MQGFAATEATSLEIIAAWVAPKKVVPSVAASPGWFVVGEYQLPTTAKARLDAVASVSSSGLTCRVRLWDVEAKAEVPGAVTFTSVASARVLGAPTTLTGGHRYQVQIECVGDVGETKFAVLETATITG